MIKSAFRQPTVLKQSEIVLFHIRSLLLQTPKRTLTSTKSEDLHFQRQEARVKLQTLLGIREHKALNMVESCKKLLTTPSSCMSENFETCIRQKVNKATIFKYPFLLCDPDLKKKLDVLVNFPIPLSASMSLTQLSWTHLKHITKLSKQEIMDRIKYLCDIFNINTEQVCNMIATKPFIIIKSLVELEAALKLLHEAGMTNEDVLKDIWVLKNSESYIQRRLEYLKYHNIKNIKTWMIRCQEDILNRKIRKEAGNRVVLGKNSLIGYLSEKLDCSESLVETIIRKYPQFHKMNLSKLDKMIDLLCNEGYTEIQICRCPKILFHSTSTVEQRLREFATFGKKAEALYVLTKSEKQYYNHVHNLCSKIESKAKTVK